MRKHGKMAKNGRNFFDIEISEKSNIAACSSDYFERYNNLPKTLKTKPESQVDIESIADAVALRLEKTLKENQKLELDTDKENQIAVILEDLDLI